MNIFKSKRKYGHIISLGYNCEISFQFFLQYHFVESALFAWANTINCNNVINVLKNPDVLLSAGLQKDGIMFKDVASGVSFHGKEGLDDLQSAMDELGSRIQYLKYKFFTSASDGYKNLYIFKYPPLNIEPDVAKKEILELHNVLTQIVKNEFDLLIILEENMYPNLQFDINNLFIRRVKFFTPPERVTRSPYDKKHFGKIFHEFCPNFKLPKSKKFKFKEKN